MRRSFVPFVTLILVGGIIEGGTSSMALAQSNPGMRLAVISGRVKDVKGVGVKGAIVAVEGQDIKATTASDGSFKVTRINPGSVFLYVKAPSKMYLDSETLKSIPVKVGATVSGIEITLSGRPSDTATYVGMATCYGRHDAKMSATLDGSPQASAHSRFVTEGTSHMVYKNKWPEPNNNYLPRDPKGKLLKVQDPRDGEGMVNVVLCTQNDEPNRQYFFKFYPRQKEGVSLAEADLNCSEKPINAVWIPVLDVLHDRLLVHRTHRRAEIPPRPQMLPPVPLAQVRKILLQPPRRLPFHVLHQLGWRQQRRCRDQQMHVVRRHRSTNDRHLARLADLPDHIAGSLRHLSPQHFVPVFRDPDQVILDVPNRVPARSIFGHHSPRAHCSGRLKLTALRRWD